MQNQTKCEGYRSSGGKSTARSSNQCRPRVNGFIFCYLRRLTKAYKDFLAANFNCVATYSGIGILHRFSRCHIELPAMPRASDHLALQLPFSQRAAAVQAGAADRVHCPRDVGQCDCLPLHLHFLDRPRRNFSKCCCPLKSHSSPNDDSFRTAGSPFFSFAGKYNPQPAHGKETQTYRHQSRHHSERSCRHSERCEESLFDCSVVDGSDNESRFSPAWQCARNFARRVSLRKAFRPLCVPARQNL